MQGSAEARYVAELAGDLADLALPEPLSVPSEILKKFGPPLRARNSLIAIAASARPDSAELRDWPTVFAARAGADRDQHAVVFDRWYRTIGHRARDDGVSALLRTVGLSRAFLATDFAAPNQLGRSPVQRLFADAGVGDRLIGGTPIAPGLELQYVAYRSTSEPPFSEYERDLLEALLPAIRGASRRLALAHGLGPWNQPLAAREREVLGHLINGDRERAIAVEVGMTYNSLHQVVVSIYRKLRVKGRPELMAAFLKGRLPPPGSAPKGLHSSRLASRDRDSA